MRVRRFSPVGPRGPTVPARLGAVFRDAPSLGEEVEALGAGDLVREEDLSLLRALVEAAEGAALGDELEVFAGMLEGIDSGRYRKLTAKQRAWAVSVAERLDLTWGDPGVRNRAVPRGAEVRLLVDSMVRPLLPPGRKAQA